MWAIGKALVRAQEMLVPGVGAHVEENVGGCVGDGDGPVVSVGDSLMIEAQVRFLVSELAMGKALMVALEMVYDYGQRSERTLLVA
jgi:hypothetical protein